MNVIVSNKYQNLLGSLDIDVIKTLNGEFNVNELVLQFSNFFYNKMILDITAIKNYDDIKSIQELSMNIDMTNVILLLNDSEKVNSPMYLSQLVSMGIYNFTKKADTVIFLLENPNTYKDVAKYQQLDGTSPLIGFNDKVEKQETEGFIGQRIIGIKNITSHAGATTLAYLMTKNIEKTYKVKTFEVNNNDFMYFSDKNLESITSDNLNNSITMNSDKEVIILDLNESNEDICTDVLYLIEPGLIKLNKLINKDSKIFTKLNGKKIMLNKSVLSLKDVEDFEKESNSKIFYNLPYVDDKLDKDEIIINLLINLGFTRVSETSSNNGIFSIF